MPSSAKEICILKDAFMGQQKSIAQETNPRTQYEKERGKKNSRMCLKGIGAVIPNVPQQTGFRTAIPPKRRTAGQKKMKYILGHEPNKR